MNEVLLGPSEMYTILSDFGPSSIPMPGPPLTYEQTLWMANAVNISLFKRPMWTRATSSAPPLYNELIYFLYTADRNLVRGAFNAMLQRITQRRNAMTIVKAPEQPHSPTEEIEYVCEDFKSLV